MQRSTFEKGFGVLVGTFPGITFNAKIMWPFLTDLSDEQFVKSIETICSTVRDIYPSTNVIALVREHAVSSKADLSAAEAFQIVMQEISRTGSYGQPKFPHESINNAVEVMGGWVRLCRSDESSLPAIRAQFIKAYESMATKKKERQMLPAQFTGLIKQITSNDKNENKVLANA